MTANVSMAATMATGIIDQNAIGATRKSSNPVNLLAHVCRKQNRLKMTSADTWFTIFMKTITPARGTKKDRTYRSFFMPKYLIYWGPNPPDPLGRFAPKIGLSPNLVAFGRIFLTKKRICL